MTALLINGLSVLMLLFFGAMALYPLFMSGPARPGLEHADEDIVLHISPAPMVEHSVSAVRHQPVAFDSTRADDPSRREAA